MFTNLLEYLHLLKFKRLFTVKKKLGEGGFGKVHLCSRKRDNAKVAVKRLRKARVTHLCECSSGVLPLEIYCLSKLQNDHIVTTHGYMETRYHWLIVMDYMEPSMDLFDYVEEKKRLEEPLTRDIFLQLHDAVSYCLARGIDHRDIKDENVLINVSTLQIKLIDFGSASLYDRNVPYTYARGTDIFLPPEFFYRGYYQAVQGTVWALGCLVYKLSVGFYPFLDTEEVRLRNPPLSDVSPLCRNFIKLCLAKTPDERMEYRNLTVHPWFADDKRSF